MRLVEVACSLVGMGNAEDKAVQQIAVVVVGGVFHIPSTEPEVLGLEVDRGDVAAVEAETQVAPSGGRTHFERRQCQD